MRWYLVQYPLPGTRMPRVLAVIRDDRQGRWMEARLRSAYPDVVFDVAPDWGGMLAGFEESYPRAFLIDVRFAEDGGPAQVRSVLRSAPWLPVLGLGGMSALSAEDAIDLRSAGVGAFVAPGEFGASEPLRVAVSGEERLVGQVLEALRERYRPRPVPAVLMGVLEVALERRLEALSVERLAERLEKRRSTLKRRLRQSGAPPPGRILRWCRVLWAVYDLTARPPARGESVAYALGFGDRSALGHALERCIGVRIRGARAMGLEGAIAKFVAEFDVRGEPRGVASGRTRPKSSTK